MVDAGWQARSGLISALIRHAEQRPDGVAFCENPSGRCLTWRELRSHVENVAARLLARHERPTVALSASNALETPVALLGALWANAEVAPLAPGLAPSPLCDVLRRANVSLVIGDQHLSTAAASMGCTESLPIARLLEEGPSPTVAPPPRGLGGSLLLLTSGTTSTPKLVRRRAQALDAVGDACHRTIGIGEGDRLLLTIPLCHSYGIEMGLLSAVFAGCRVELHDGFALPRVRTALQGGVTILPAVPFLFDVLTRAEPATPWPFLRRAISAGGPLPRTVFDEFVSGRGVPIGQIYGATEFGAATWSDPTQPGFAPHSVGRPLPGVEIRIVDPEEPDRLLPTAAEGRIAVATPSRFEGYVGETVAADASEDFFQTGDLGRLDARGNLEVTGRISLLIDVGGRKVNPVEIECVLESHPAVAAAAVVPVPYSRTVTRMKALIVPATPREPSPEELRAYLEERVASYKIPRSFEMRSALPRSATGKVVRHRQHDAEHEPLTDRSR